MSAPFGKMHPGPGYGVETPGGMGRRSILSQSRNFGYLSPCINRWPEQWVVEILERLFARGFRASRSAGMMDAQGGDAPTRLAR